MIKREPFKSYRLDEEKVEDKSEVITVRLNQQERKLLNEVKQILGISEDSKALKKGFFAGHFVLHSQFTEQFWKGLMRKER